MSEFGILKIVPTAGSTQDLATKLAARGDPEGTALMALSQTEGRGRSGREWISPPRKNLALSLILRPTMPLAEVPLLGLLASVAVAETVESLGVDAAELKWPNDVVVKGKKIAGVLPEATADGRSIRYVIMGIGLNVNSELSDFADDFPLPATSLIIETGIERDVVDVAREFLRKMGSLYERALSEGRQFIVPLWEARWAHRGMILESAGLSGIAEGLDPDGALLIRTREGELARVVSGEVSPVPHGG